jgi:hypothetical protein
MPDKTRPIIEPFSVDHLHVDRLLADWQWRCPQPVTLVARNVFGDLFLRTAEGKVLWLQVATAALSEVADSEPHFRDLLEEPANRAAWFAEADARAAAERGLKANDVQCIGFKVPLVFAESGSADNAYVADLYEQVSFLGHLHRQMANLPEGTKVKLQITE